MSGFALMIAAFFLVVMGGVFAAGYFVQRRQAMADGSVPIGEDDEAASAQQVFVGTLRTLGEVVPPPAAKQSPLRQQLNMAGYRSPQAVATFRGIQLALAIVPALLTGLLTFVTQGDSSAAMLVTFAIAGVGYLLPERVLNRKIQSRKQRLRRGLPSAMDMLILSTEAGQSLDQSFADLSRQLRRPYPDLATEFAIVSMELRTGNSRASALRNFADRTGEGEVRKLVNLLIDGDRFGASLAPTLRSQARHLRTRMRQQTQEAARKIGVKLTFPLVLLIFPALLLVTLGPALIQMFDVLGNMFNGI